MNRRASSQRRPTSFRTCAAIPMAGRPPPSTRASPRSSQRHPDIEFVGWLNADDVFLGDGIATLAEALAGHPGWVAAAGRGCLADEAGTVGAEIATAPFVPETFARWCTICQPATLVRRAAWEAVHGLDASLDMCFDYDLWWRLSHIGQIGYVDTVVAASRDHGTTKTRTRRAGLFRRGPAHRRPRTRHRAVALVHQRSARTRGRLRHRQASHGHGQTARRRAGRRRRSCGIAWEARHNVARLVHITPRYWPARGGARDGVRATVRTLCRCRPRRRRVDDGRADSAWAHPREANHARPTMRSCGVSASAAFRRGAGRASASSRTLAHYVPAGRQWHANTLRWTPWVPTLDRACAEAAGPVDVVHAAGLPYSSLLLAGERLARPHPGPLDRDARSRTWPRRAGPAG